ncbi:hypothetical protein X797_011506 [Metarhizium robertsii]|uniref:Uncharacterized protein n=1 Tax=Metarhizium robertsii TaxID=568076 RepID=A0A014P246_9HYPO|nr:hypothetical protein X797_011506 [Metarhizium robertsii]
MHLSTLAVVASLSAVLAAPADSPDVALRDPSVYFCKHVDFEPPCIYIAGPPGRCGPSFDASYPGYSNLIYDVPGFNDQISSFRCDY